MVLAIGLNEGPRPKCLFYSSLLPTFINHDQPPMKKRPFTTITENPLSHTLDIVLPKDAASRLKSSLEVGDGVLQYARVNMKLSDLVSGDFFSQYIKTGNIVMLSEGRPGVDHIYTLQEGILRLEVDRPTFERMGLEGKPIPHEGRKHVKATYAIELNLRMPAMVRGKKGFQRILWAFDNVLNHSLTWLFSDTKSVAQGSGPIAAHHPIIKCTPPEFETLSEVKMPLFPSTAEPGDREELCELLEWLSFALNIVPRIQQDDHVDPYLCRYDTPNFEARDGQNPSVPAQDLVRLHWHGFVTSAFVTKMLLAALKAAGNGWFAMSAISFDAHSYTIFKDKDRVMAWQCED